jgi:DNA polymerase-3 subunit gamma/tau
VKAAVKFCTFEKINRESFMSSFVVSARKYRPIRFEEVVGQEHVSQTLKNALKNDHLAHAFLFCGPRGVGKTTCARILAKVLNCQNLGTDYEPCNTCDSCKAFNDNSSFNITELDAASNNSVEHIRALIEQVRFQPQQGKYKVFIIDEVHMLSQQAFNAFLKTLEEPPSYAIFILATTEKHKIIPTILSRCQIFDFKRIQVPAMVKHLEQICSEEGINAEPEALHIIGQKADGALRDALSIFDRIVAFSGKEIKYNDVIENLNVLDYDYYFKVVDALLTEDVSSILMIFDDIQRKGFDGDIFMTGLAEHFRNLLVCKDPQTIQLLDRSENIRERYLQQTLLTPTALIITALDICNTCDIEYRMARNKRLHVEMALIKMTHIPQAIKVSQLQATGELLEKKTPEISNPPEIAEPDIPAQATIQETKAEEEVEQEETVAPTPEPAPQNVQEAVPAEQPVTPPAPKIKSSEKHSMPKLKGLNALVAEVKEHDTTGEIKAVEEISLEELNEVWQAFLEGETQDSVRVMLQYAVLSLEDKEMVVTVGSNLAENTLKQEFGLMDFIRGKLGVKDLMLKIKVDKEKAPEPPKRQKPLTSKEKFLKMRELNPVVSSLQKRFDLRPDED